MTIAKDASATAFNDRAGRQGWPTHCDIKLAFQSAVLADLLGIWKSHACHGAIPQRSGMSARVLKAHLGNIAIFEQAGQARYRVRLMGTYLAQTLGEMQGKFVAEVIPAEICSRWHAAFNAVLGERKPLRFTTRIGFGNLDYLQAEILLAPLLMESETDFAVLAGVVFKAITPQGAWAGGLTVSA